MSVRWLFQKVSLKDWSDATRSSTHGWGSFHVKTILPEYWWHVYLTGDFRFACEQCGKGFQVKSYLTIHMKVHSQAKPYKCSTCGAQMKSKQALIDHENRHLGVKAFKCNTCDRSFISRALLVTHEKTHGDEAITHKYPCTVCNKMFVRRAYLKTHMTIHSGNKPFICDVSLST